MVDTESQSSDWRNIAEGLENKVSVLYGLNEKLDRMDSRISDWLACYGWAVHGIRLCGAPSVRSGDLDAQTA